MTDTRIAFGACCTWWGSIYEVATAKATGFGIPACPHCRGPLLEEPDIKSFRKRLDAVPSGSYPDYRKVMEWQRITKRPCERTYKALRDAYDRRSR